MKIIITGATGLVGEETLRQAIEDKDITEITAIVRKPLNIRDPKIKTVIHADFLNYSGLETVFKENDACLWCLGISQSQVSEVQYNVITYEYTIAAGKAMLAANPAITFLFVSGMGAYTSEKGMTLFGRVKGKTENELQRMPFKKLFIVRPGGIQPIHKNPNTSFFNKLFIPLFPLLKLLMPASVITSAELGRVMLHIVKKGTSLTISENPELLRILTDNNL